MIFSSQLLLNITGVVSSELGLRAVVMYCCIRFHEEQALSHFFPQTLLMEMNFLYNHSSIITLPLGDKQVYLVINLYIELFFIILSLYLYHWTFLRWLKLRFSAFLYLISIDECISCRIWSAHEAILFLQLNAYFSLTFPMLSYC